MTDRRVALLHVGDELLDGRVVNTGGPAIAVALSGAGFRICAMEMAADEVEAIQQSVSRLVADADAVVVTGGLGPTPDDVTRDALAAAAGAPLVTDPELLAEVVRRTRGLAPEANEKQAAIPQGSVCFRNPVGVAAAFRTEILGRPVYALPGVPSELEALLHDALLPDLQARFPDVGAPESAVIRVFGVPEAVLVERLGALLARDQQPEVGVTVRHGVLTIAVRGPGAADRAQAVRDVLGEDVCAVGRASLASALVSDLRRRGTRIAIAESLTGGLVADAVVAIPGASDVLLGGVIAYTADMKHNLLGVPLEVIAQEGVVSETVVRAMARGVRERFGADYGVATTGAAGPDPEQDGTRPGSGFVAVSGPGGVEEVRPCRSGGDRDAVRRRFANAALDLLRRVVSLSC